METQKRPGFKIYGIKGNATISYWIRQSQAIPGDPKDAIPIANFAEMKQNIQDKKLQEENKELKELLRVAELRADLWQHAIEVAEQKLGIDILKKPGAQQSNPSKNKKPKEKIIEMCKVFGYSKQAYYKQLHTAENTAAKEATVVGLIHQKRTLWKRGSGRNLHKCLEPELANQTLKWAGISSLNCSEITIC